MKAIWKKFCLSDDGAVTVDWVVLTAAVVTLGFMAVSGPLNGTSDLSAKIQSFLSTKDPESM